MFCGARPALGALSFLGGLGASPVRPRRLAVLEERLVTLSNPRGCVTALCALLRAEIESSRALIASVFTTLGGKFAATSSSSTRSQTAVPRPAQSHDSPFLPVRRLERNRKLQSLQTARLQLGTATQHRLP